MSAASEYMTEWLADGGSRAVGDKGPSQEVKVDSLGTFSVTCRSREMVRPAGMT